MIAFFIVTAVKTLNLSQFSSVGRLLSHPDDGSATFARNVGSYKSRMA
jgi:hypothetical protein